jgi:hypothetical protein
LALGDSHRAAAQQDAIARRLGLDIAAATGIGLMEP